MEFTCVLFFFVYFDSSDKDSSGILSCSACHREAGLWNFCSLKSVSQIKNGVKEVTACEQQSGEVIEGTQRSDGEAEENTPFEQGVSEGSQRSERDTDEEMCERGVNMDDEGTQMEQLGTEEDIPCEVGVPVHNEEMEHYRMEEEMSGEVGIVGNVDVQKDELGLEEDVSGEVGIVGNVDVQKDELGLEGTCLVTLGSQ